MYVVSTSYLSGMKLYRMRAEEKRKKSGSVERRRKRYVIEHPSRLSYCKKKIIKIKKFLTVPERVEIFLVHYTPTLSVTGAAERCSASSNE